MTDWVPYYNRAGTRIHHLEYCDLAEDAAYRTIAVDRHDKVTISTIWVGIDAYCPPGCRPRIFETRVIGGDCHGFIRRYTSEDAARCGHMNIMELLLEGRTPCAMAPVSD